MLIIMWKTINYCVQTSSKACTMAANTIILLIALSDSQRIRRKKLLYKLYCFAGKTFRNKVTKEKSSFVLDTGISQTSQNSSQGHISVTMLHSYPVAGEKNLTYIIKYFWIYSISFSPKRLNDHTNKARSHQTSDYVIIIPCDRRFFHKNAVYVRSNSASV